MPFNDRLGLTITMVAAYAIAFFNFAIGPIRFVFLAQGNDMPGEKMLGQCTIVALVWIAIVSGALVVYRAQALRILVGAPIALFWPGIWVVFGGLNLAALMQLVEEYLRGT
jgi:hypothetical protein